MSRQPLCTLRLIARLCFTRRYDIEEYVREWLMNNGNKEHPTFEHLSLIEVVLVDDRFEEIRPHVGISDAFISHMDMDPFLGVSDSNGMNRESTMEQLFMLFLSYPELKGKYLWCDYFSLR